MLSEAVVERRHVRPSERLATLVTRIVGYRYSGLEPGFHRGMPSCQLTVVISLGPPTCVTGMPDPGQHPGEFGALVGGLHTRPALITHDGTQFGVQLDLTPAGSRALLGVPAGALGPSVIELADLLGSTTHELVERCLELDDWDARFAVVEEVLLRRAGERRPVPEQLDHAWRSLTRSEGSARVGEVAAEIGWSRRHLWERFASEFGVTPKDAVRIARFQRSHLLLRRLRRTTLAAVAMESGYYDQAHMARDWNELAGCPPSEWLATEKLPFVQDPLVAAQPD